MAMMVMMMTAAAIETRTPLGMILKSGIVSEEEDIGEMLRRGLDESIDDGSDSSKLTRQLD